MQVTKNSELSVLLEVAPLIYDICQEKDKVKYNLNERCHK